MDFQVHPDFSSLDPAEWNALVEEGVTDVPFLRYEYLSGWWQTLGGGEWKQAKLVLVSARENGRLAGIAPLFLVEHDDRPVLMLVGSIEISDYLDLIVRPADLTCFLSGLVDFLVSTYPDSWRGFDWYNLPDASPTLAALEAEAGRRGWTCTEDVYHPTPVIALQGSYDAYLATIDKKQRHEIRRKVRRAEEGHSLRWYIVEDETTLDSEIDAFLSLMEDDQQKAEFLTQVMRSQMRSAVHAAFRGGWLWLAFLEVDGEKAATALNFDYKNRLWGYNSGVNRRFMELSPGWVLLAHVLQWAADHGRAEFDFMRGDEEYKYRFGAVKRHVMRARLTR